VNLLFAIVEKDARLCQLRLPNFILAAMILPKMVSLHKISSINSPTSSPISLGRLPDSIFDSKKLKEM
jgi:hypothetical protein